MTMEERPAAALAVLASWLDDFRKAGVRMEKPSLNMTKEMLRAAFPELFDGTAWLAPMELTNAMEDAWARQPADGYDPYADWAAMRDAHLAPTSPSSTPGTS